MITLIAALMTLAAPVEAQVEPPGAGPAPTDDMPLSYGALVMEEGLPHALEAGWKGEDTCELLQETDDMRMFRCAFEPGQGHERHWHPAHFGYVVEGGSMRITDDDGTRVQEVPAGYNWLSEGVRWHEVVNVGDTTAVYVMVEPKEREGQ